MWTQCSTGRRLCVLSPTYVNQHLELEKWIKAEKYCEVLMADYHLAEGQLLKVCLLANAGTFTVLVFINAQLTWNKNKIKINN